MLHCSVVKNLQLSNTAKRSLFKIIFVLVLTFGYQPCVVTAVVLKRKKRKGIFKKSSRPNATRQKYSCEIPKSLNVEPLLLRIEISKLQSFGQVTRMRKEKLAWESCWLDLR